MDVTMRLRSLKIAATVAVAVSLLSAPLLSGCSREKAAPKNSATKQESKIEQITGMRYYVGGPVMKPDNYGRLRLAGFNGQVTTPSSRGLLIGYKPNGDGTFLYRTWINGRSVQESKGFLDEQGLLWFTERATYDSQERVIARQKLSYDNDKQIMTSNFEQIDPETGEVVKTTKRDMPYAPPESPDEEEDDAGDE